MPKKTNTEYARRITPRRVAVASMIQPIARPRGPVTPLRVASDPYLRIGSEAPAPSPSETKLIDDASRARYDEELADVDASPPEDSPIEIDVELEAIEPAKAAAHRTAALEIVPPPPRPPSPSNTEIDAGVGDVSPAPGVILDDDIEFALDGNRRRRRALMTFSVFFVLVFGSFVGALAWSHLS